STLDGQSGQALLSVDRLFKTSWSIVTRRGESTFRGQSIGNETIVSMDSRGGESRFTPARSAHHSRGGHLTARRPRVPSPGILLVRDYGPHRHAVHARGRALHFCSAIRRDCAWSGGRGDRGDELPRKCDRVWRDRVCPGIVVRKISRGAIRVSLC